MPKIKNIESGEVLTVFEYPKWVAGIWECGDQRFTDKDGTLFEPLEAETVEAAKVSPVQFKLLFTPVERVAMKEARKDDPVIADFFDIVEDPRLTFVDLGLQSTKDAIAYLVSKNLLTETRMDEILSGQMK